MTTQGQGHSMTPRFDIFKLLFLKKKKKTTTKNKKNNKKKKQQQQQHLGRLKPNFLWSLHGMLGWKFVQMFRVTWPRWLPSPYMVKTFKMSFFGTKRPMTLKRCIRHRVLKYYQTGSNDDTGLTMPIFMIWSNMFPDPSVRVKADTAYSHIFSSLFLFSISYALMWAIQAGPMVLWF